MKITEQEVRYVADLANLKLTDQEIGSAPIAGNVFMPWDGVRGPSMRKVGNNWMAVYTDAIRTDYIDLIGTMTAAAARCET